MYALALVFVGGGVGDSLRHLLTSAAARFFRHRIPLGDARDQCCPARWRWDCSFTAGSRRALGCATSISRLFLATSVSAAPPLLGVSLDVAVLWQRAHTGAAAGYVAASVIFRSPACSRSRARAGTVVRETLPWPLNRVTVKDAGAGSARPLPRSPLSRSRLRPVARRSSVRQVRVRALARSPSPRRTGRTVAFRRSAGTDTAAVATAKKPPPPGYTSFLKGRSCSRIATSSCSTPARTGSR